jgi:hypothetical protein
MDEPPAPPVAAKLSMSSGHGVKKKSGGGGTGKVVATVGALVVLLKDGAGRKAAEKLAGDLGGSIVGQVDLISLYQIETKGASEADLKAALARAQGQVGVEMALPNVGLFLKDIKGVRCADPLSDPTYQQGQNGRHYDMIGLRGAWDILKASGAKLNDVTVGVMDTAIYTKSDEISGKVKVSEIETRDSTAQPETDQSGNVVDGGLNHGTMVTHVIGADPDNGGVAGVGSILGDKLKVNVSNIYDRQNFTVTTPDANDPMKMAVIDAVAVPKKPMEYAIRATVENVGEKGTEVSIDLNGQGAIAGLSKQRLGAPGEVSWGFNFLTTKDTASLTVRRLDTGGCSRVAITQSILAGKWSGASSITDFKMPGLEGMPPEMMAQMRAGMGTGQLFPAEMLFEEEPPESGRVTGRGEGGNTASTSYSFKDGVVTMTYSESTPVQSRSQLTARVTESGGTYVMEGDWQGSASGNGVTIEVWGSYKATKVQ